MLISDARRRGVFDLAGAAPSRIEETSFSHSENQLPIFESAQLDNESVPMGRAKTARWRHRTAVEGTPKRAVRFPCKERSRSREIVILRR
jgi:hypothetical protein